MNQLTTEDLAAIRHRWDRECICPGTLFEEKQPATMCGVCTIRQLLDDAAAVQAKLETSELQRKDDGERHSANYDAIVKACGAPGWEYPGQVARDVRRLRKERDEGRVTIRGLLVLLRHAEWQAGAYREDERCVECFGEKPDHKAGCALAAVLGAS